MPITVPAAYPNPDPAEFVARSPIVGNDTGIPARTLRNLGRAQNYEHAWGGTSPTVLQEWQDSRFSDINVRSGGAAPEGTFRCRWLAPIPQWGSTRIQMRVGVRATSNAGSGSLVEFESLGTGNVVQIAIPNGTVGQWIWSDGAAIPHLQITRAWAPVLPGDTNFDVVRMYTSGDAANAHVVHAVMVQHLVIPTVAPNWPDDSEFNDDAVLSARVGRNLMRNAYRLSNTDRQEWPWPGGFGSTAIRLQYPRMIWNWSSVQDLPAAADLATFGPRIRRAPRIINPGGPGPLRFVEAHCYLGDPANVSPATFQLVMGGVGEEQFWDPSDRPPGAQVLRFDRSAVAGRGWNDVGTLAPRVCTMRDESDIQGPPGDPFRVAMVEAQAGAAAATGSDFVESFAVFGA